MRFAVKPKSMSESSTFDRLLAPQAPPPPYVPHVPETWPEALYVSGLPGWWSLARFVRNGDNEEEPQYRLPATPWIMGCLRWDEAFIRKQNGQWTLSTESGFDSMRFSNQGDGPVGKWCSDIEVYQEEPEGYYETP